MIVKEVKKANKRLKKVFDNADIIKSLKEEKEKREKDIIKIYKEVFRGISHRRIFTHIRINEDMVGNLHYVAICRSGFSLVVSDKYEIVRTIYEFSFDTLCDICMKYRELMKYVTKRKARIIKKFCSEIAKIDKIDNVIEKTFKRSIETDDEDDKENDDTRIKKEIWIRFFGGEYITIRKAYGSYVAYGISLTGTRGVSIFDKMLLEQIKGELLQMQKEYIKNLKRYNRQLKRCINNLEKKFVKELILSKLKEE